MAKSRRMVFHSLLLALGFFGRGAIAQEESRLMSTWRDTQQADTVRLKALNTLIWKYYENSRKDSAVQLANEQLKLAERCGAQAYIGQAYGMLGNIANAKGDRANAIRYHELGLSVAEKMGSLEGISAELVEIGNIYVSLGDHDRAVEQFERAIRVTERSKDIASRAQALLNIGNIFLHEKDLDAAVGYFEQSLT